MVTRPLECPSSQPLISPSAVKPVLPVGGADSRCYTELNVLYLYSSVRRGVLFDQAGPQGTVELSERHPDPILAGAWKRGLQVCMCMCMCVQCSSQVLPWLPPVGAR